MAALRPVGDGREKKGCYKRLHESSSAYSLPRPRKRVLESRKVYCVEHLFNAPCREKRVLTLAFHSYFGAIFFCHPLVGPPTGRPIWMSLVLWDGYPPWDALREAEEQITQLAIKECFCPVVPEPTAAARRKSCSAKSARRSEVLNGRHHVSEEERHFSL